MATSSALVLALPLATATPAQSQTVVNVNAPGSLTAATGTTTPANGDVWNLNSTGIFLNAQVILPAATPGLTINGNGNTLTLNNGAASFFRLNAAGTLILSDLTISGGSGVSSIYAGSFALTLDTTGGVVFTGNNSNNGGAITAGAVTFNGDDITVTNNSAGGGVFGSGGGGAILASGDVSIGNANSTVTLSGNKAGSDGGAISSSGVVTINGSGITVTDNGAGSSFGGAIHASGNVSIGNASSTVTLTGNTAGGGGGAIYSTNGAVTIDGSEITMTDNSAGGDGGVIRANGVVLIGNADSVVMLTGNTATANGGVIASNGAVTVNGGDITVAGNTAGVNGGAVSALGAVLIGSAASTVTLTGNSTGGVGGAISSNGTVTINGSVVTLTGNTAANTGGAIYGAAAVTIDGNAITLTDNSVTTFGSQGGAIFGGVVSIGNVGSTVTLSGNSGNVGGAVFGLSGPVTLTGNVNLTDNHATNGNGGAIFAVTGGVTVNGNLTAADNTTSSSGGVVYAQAGPVMVVGDADITGNRATLGSGGAIFTGGGDVSIGNAGSTVTLSGNSAGGSGGAIAATGSVLIGNATSTVTASDNTAGGGGGAIFGSGAVMLAGSTVMLTGNSANGSGGAIYGFGASVTIDGGAVTLSGNSAVFGGAIFAAGSVVLNTTGPSQFSNNRAGDQGGAIFASGNVTLNAAGGDLTFSGNMENTATTAQANAIYLNNAAASPVTATFNAAAGSSITFFDPIQSNAARGLVTVTKTGAGTVAFDGSLYTNPVDRLSQVFADTTVQEGTFAVRNNAVYGALGADVSVAMPESSFTVDSGATLAGGIAGEVRADDFALNGTLNIAGTAPPGSASGGFSTFTVTGSDVSFGAGSQVLFNAYLNDASVQRSDLLVLNLNGGATIGTAGIFVTNVGGPGGLTTGNGIQLVQANGTTAGAFTLANPELRAGAFDYRLFQGGPDGSDPNNWYLRSVFIPPPVPPVPPEPIIGPELATYGVVQPMAQQLGRAMLGTHDERFGDLYAVRPPCEPETNVPNYTKAPVYTKAPTDCAYGWRPAVWGRLFGQQIDDHYQAFADPRASGQIAGFQAGVDVLRSDSLIAGHTDYAGLYFAYGNANVDVTGLITNPAATANVLQHTGALNLNAYSGGAYWTHYGPQGWHLDLTLQGTAYDGAASTEFAHLDTTGSGFISSLEGGYPIALPVFGPGFVLEPQAQVLWQWVSFDSGNDGLGPVALGTTSETTARVGLKGKWTITTDGGQVWQPYMRVNYWSDFGGDSATLFGTDSIPLISHAQYMDVDAGFTTRINTHLSAFADAGYQFAVSNDGGKRDGVKGSAGLRYQW